MILRIGPWVVRGASTPSSARTGPRAWTGRGHRGRAGGLEDRPGGGPGRGRAGPARHVRPRPARAGELPGDRCVVSYCYLGGEEPPSRRAPSGRPTSTGSERCWRPSSPPSTRATTSAPAAAPTARPAAAASAPRPDPHDRRRPSDLRDRLGRAAGGHEGAGSRGRGRAAVGIGRDRQRRGRRPFPGTTNGRRPPTPPGGGDPPFAGAVAGLGAAEVERRRLTGAQVEEIVRAEVADRETAAADYEPPARSTPNGCETKRGPRLPSRTA